jgi:hypothetical protein
VSETHNFLKKEDATMTTEIMRKIAAAYVGVDVAGLTIDDLLDEDQEEQVKVSLEFARWSLAQAHSTLRDAFKALGGTEEDRRAQVHALLLLSLKETRVVHELAKLKIVAALGSDPDDLPSA